MEALPAGPVSRVFEGVAVLATPLPAGSMPFGMVASPAGLPARAAYPLTLDATGQLRVVGSFTPAPPAPGSFSRARINISVAGDNTIIQAVVGQTIRIQHINFCVNANNNVVTLKDGAAIIADYDFVARQAFAFDSPGGLYPLDLSLGAAFVIGLSAAFPVTGFVIYTQS